MFVVVELPSDISTLGYFKEVLSKKINAYERNFKHFNERELWFGFYAFIDQRDPDLDNLYNNIIFYWIFPYRKLTKKEYKLKSEHWISNEKL